MPFDLVFSQSITSSIGKASASSAGASSGTSSSKTFAVEKPVVSTKTLWLTFVSLSNCALMQFYQILFIRQPHSGFKIRILDFRKSEINSLKMVHWTIVYFQEKDIYFDGWELKKSILNTLFQAVKAITGGVTAIKGQLIKGSGYALSHGGKVYTVYLYT